MVLRISLILLAGAAALAAQKQCYFPQKNIHSLGIPCDPDAEGAVACCQATHTCLSNKLCWDTKTSHVLRGGCTDSTFEDPGCPQFCKGAAQGGGLAYLRQCNGGSDRWTCTPAHKFDVTNCTAPFSVDPGFVQDYRSSNVSNVIFANGNTTKGLGSVSSPVHDNDVRQAKLQVGLGAGLGIGLPLLMALGLSLWFLRRAQQELKRIQGNQFSRSSNAASAWAPPYGAEQTNKPQGPPTSSAGGYASGSPPVYPPIQYTQVLSQQQPATLPYQPPYQPSPTQRTLSPQELESDDGRMLRQEVDSATVQLPLSASQTPTHFYAEPVRTQ